MTHTSTEQPDPLVIIEKLRAQHRAEIHETWIPLVADLRIQLEASQARVPLSKKDIDSLLESAGYLYNDNTRADFINGIRYAEMAHGITQEKQG